MEDFIKIITGVCIGIIFGILIILAVSYDHIILTNVPFQIYYEQGPSVEQKIACLKNENCMDALNSADLCTRKDLGLK